MYEGPTENRLDELGSLYKYYYYYYYYYITKPGDPSPPTSNKVEFGAKWVKMSAFLATTLLGEVGGRRNEPKAEQNIVIRSRVLRNNCLEGLFHTVPSSFVLHCLSIEWTNSR